MTITIDDYMEEIQHGLTETNVSMMELSRRSGVAYNTLRAIKAGKANPTISTLREVMSAMYSPLDGKTTCEECRFCLVFDSNTEDYACEIPAAPKDDPLACIMYTPAKEGDGL